MYCTILLIYFLMLDYKKSHVNYFSCIVLHYTEPYLYCDFLHSDQTRPFHLHERNLLVYSILLKHIVQCCVTQAHTNSNFLKEI